MITKNILLDFNSADFFNVSNDEDLLITLIGDVYWQSGEALYSTIEYMLNKRFTIEGGLTEDDINNDVRLNTEYNRLINLITDHSGDIYMVTNHLYENNILTGDIVIDKAQPMFGGTLITYRVD